MTQTIQPPRRRRRRRWFKIGLALFVVSMTIVAAEFATRLCWQPPLAFAVVDVAPSWWSPEPDAFEPLPNFVGGFLEALPQDAPPSARFAPRVLEVRINSHGLRGAELADKRPGERRILFGGDSLTFGHFVADEDSFPALTAASLRAAGLPGEAVNAGVPGYGFAATCRRLGRLRATVGADALVAAYFLGNDFVDDIQQRTSVVVDGRLFSGPFGNLLRHSARGRLAVRSRLALLVESWLIEHQPAWSVLPHFSPTAEQAALSATLPVGRTVAGLYLDAPAGHAFATGGRPVVQAWLDDVEQSLRLLRTAADGLPVLVVILPTQFHIDAELRSTALAEVGLDEHLLQPGNAQRHLLELCSRLELPCVDTTPALLAEAQPKALYGVDHLHPSATGNRVIAATIAAKLRELLR